MIYFPNDLFIDSNAYSFGAHVISGMATELIDAGLGKIDRLTLLDPGCKVPTKLRIDGKKQYGLINKVRYRLIMCSNILYEIVEILSNIED